jgi:isocitrate lyase
VPNVVRRINQALVRADEIEGSEGKRGDRYWFAPIVADAEAGFGGPLNAYELMKGMIEAGASAVHFEDQLSSEKKCGHLGGKVLVPTAHFQRTLVAARLAADVLDVPTLLVARTDADSARLLTSDVDERDRPFCTGERTSEGFYRISGGIPMATARALAYAPYADLLWCETSTPDLAEAKAFAEGVHAEFPDKMLAYNCSPSFNWRKNLDGGTIAKFQRELGAMGYKFQFVTLAGFHQLNFGMFELARAYHERDMAAYADLQDREFAAGGAGLHGHAPPARGRHRLLRRGLAGDQRRARLDARPQGVHRGRPVLTSGRPDSREKGRARRAVPPDAPLPCAAPPPPVLRRSPARPPLHRGPPCRSPTVSTPSRSARSCSCASA